LCVELLRDSMLPAGNLFCYGQVKSAYGSGQFKRDLDLAFRGEEKVVTTRSRTATASCLRSRTFLGKGR
jgi:hypothetical protein